MATLPSGAVTFLFTDIEGSTQLVRQLRDGYADALVTHQRLLREAFANHDGYEVDTQGDAFFYAFGSAHDAVLGAVEGQRALSQHQWPDDSELKVRIGLHTARAAPVDGRYTGLAVHRASRICSAAHGGQILVSQATQSLLEDEEEELAAGLRDLGEHRLKDIERPVRLYQVAAPGLATDFPPPRGEERRGDAASARPLWRRWPVLAAAAVLLVTAILGVVLATRSSNGGLSEVRPNYVGVIDPQTNEIRAEVPVGQRPGPVTVGDGAVWVGNQGDRTLTKIDAATRSPIGTIPLVDYTPTGLDLGAGSLWVAEGALGYLAVIDPDFEQVDQIKVADEALGAPYGSVAVGAGAVWAVYGDSTLARVDPARKERTGKTLTEAGPSGIAVESGTVWVVNSHRATVQGFDPDSFEQGSVIDTPVGSRPTAIAGAGGVLWVANTGSDSVTRLELSTEGAFPKSQEIQVGHAPSAIAVGGGAVWVANSGDGTVSRIDPRTRDVVATIDVGNAPSGIAFGGGAVWLSVQAPVS